MRLDAFEMKALSYCAIHKILSILWIANKKMGS